MWPGTCQRKMLVQTAVSKELLCVIRYVLDTKNLYLKLEPTGNASEPWEIVCFSNSKYAGDPMCKRNVSRFILYILGVWVSWTSKAQRSMTLSSLVTEWAALLKTVKEVMFVIQLLGSMKVLVKLPVMVRVDNVGAIFMVSNITTMSKTKHVDIR